MLGHDSGLLRGAADLACRVAELCPIESLSPTASGLLCNERAVLGDHSSGLRSAERLVPRGDDLHAESLPAAYRSVLRGEWDLQGHNGGGLPRAEYLARGVDELLPESMSAHAWGMLRGADGGLHPRLLRELSAAESLAHRVDDLLAESLSGAGGRML